MKQKSLRVQNNQAIDKEKRTRNTVPTEARDAIKIHKTGEAETKVADETGPGTDKGEPAATAGLSGVGKMMTSNTSGGTDIVMLGMTHADNADTIKPNENESIKHCCDDAGPAP